MSKQKIILVIAVVLVIIVGGYFGWRKVVSNQQSMTSARGAMNNVQNPIESIQNSTDSEQSDTISQGAISNEQQTVTSNQELVTGAKESVKTVEQKIETKNSDSGKIVQKLVAWGFQKATGRKIDTIILHTSYNALGGDEFDKDKVIQEWKDAGVAPHYLIARDGTIYQLVSDQNIAWHAGVAKMPDGRTDVNAFSIGVEIINTQDGKFTSDQYTAVNRLIGDLKNKYPIKNILGHSDIAPGRKTDPWGIEWKKIDK